MPFNPAFFVADDRFAVSRERNRLYVKLGFFLYFANDRIRKLLTGLNPAAGQGVEVERGLARAPHDQHLAIADDGCAHRQDGTLRIGSLVSHAFYRFIS